jgi:hypothetical protein
MYAMFVWRNPSLCTLCSFGSTFLSEQTSHQYFSFRTNQHQPNEQAGSRPGSVFVRKIRFYRESFRACLGNGEFKWMEED